jgi:hypothetical protein
VRAWTKTFCLTAEQLIAILALLALLRLIELLPR